MKFTLRSMARATSWLVVLSTMTMPGLAQDRGFSNERSTRHYTRSRTFDVLHLKLDLSFDHEQGTVMGTATTTLTPINDGLKQVVLDAVDLSIEAVYLLTTAQVESATRQGNRRLDFVAENDQLVIDLDRAYRSGETLTIEVAYHGQPKMGLYFVRPDEGYPDK
ncbi:MAG: hypothetical protein IIB42_01310, partial [Candidatus Marinimicrobia bacterium]|nr:hypothetical protein [Candidatus Neomarinimicrobiota bacterium]